jgi:hypothetical protein
VRACARLYTHTWLVGPHVSRTAVSQTPPVAPVVARPLSQTPSAENRGPFPHPAHQRRGFPDPRCLPPKGPSRPAARLRSPRDLSGRHWCLGLAASTQLPTRVCPYGYGLGPRRLAGYSPERRGHVPPFDFYSCMELRAQPRVLRLRCPLRATEVSRAATAVPLAGTRRPSRCSPGVV